MKTKAIAVAMLAAVLAMSFALVVTPDSDAYAVDDVVAIEDKGYTSLSAAVSEAENGVTIKLLNNVKEDVTIPAGKEIVLDLAGFTLTNVSKHTIIVEDGAKLTVSGGTVDNVTHQKAAIYSSGEVIINGGTFTRSAEVILSSENDYKSSNSWYLIVNMGTMTINGGTFYTGDGTASKLGNNSSLIVNGTEDNSAPGTMTINGGTFTNAANVLKNNSGDVVINGGTLTMDNTVIGWAGGNQCIQHVEGTMTINGGSISTIGTGVGINPADAKYVRSVVYVSEDSTSVTITDGSFIADGANTYMFRNKSIEVDIQINGGNFETKADAVSTIGVGGLDLKGGFFFGYKPVAQDGMEINVTITGAGFDSKIDGSVASIVKDGQTFYYNSLGSAIAAADGGKITLQDDVECIPGLIIADVITNGFTISHNVVADPAVEPTFISEGKTEGSHCSICNHVIITQTVIPKVTVSNLIDAFGSIQGYEPTGTASVSENGVSITYDGSYTGEDVMNDLARFLGVMYNTGKLTTLTYDGKAFKWDADKGLMGSNWANNGTTLVSVLVDDFRAGRITDSVSLKLGDNSTFTITFDAEFVAVVGDLQSKGTVTYSQFADAVAVGGDVTLLADVNETAAIQVTKDVTINLNGKSLTAKFDIVSEGDVTPTFAFKGDLTKANVQVNGSTAITFGTLKLTVPASKAFAADGKAITVSEASLEGTVPEGFDLIVTSKATIPAGKTVEGAIWFDTAKDNGIALSSVKAGTSGVTLTKGSVEIVGDFIATDGTITVTGIARIVGDSTMDGIKLIVPKGASLTVEEGASVTGTGSISNAGTVKVLGDLATALDNTADAVVQVALTGSIDTDKVTGDGKVSFDSIILRDIGTKYYRVGDKVDIPVTVNPTTATLTIDYTVSPSWLTIRDGHIVGIVAQEGSFNVTVKASMEDRETVSESFVINAVPGVDPDEPQDHEFTFKEIVKIAVIILVVLMVICLVTRAFIG